MNKKISIITINLNNQIGLQKTIDSVLNQTWKDFEFIIIDGGSTDGSKVIIEANRHHLAYYISEPDGGVYNAMNKGIKVAGEDFIFFLNSGDVFYNNVVLEKIQPYLNDSYQIFYGDIIYQEKDVQVTRRFPDKLTFKFFIRDNINHQACFINRKLFYEFFFYNEEYKIVSDWEFLIYVICCKNVFYKHINQIISIYDTTGISSNSDNHYAMNEDKRKTLAKYFPLFIEDYNHLQQLSNKKIDQFIFIKQRPFAYKILKACMNIILLFLPKFERTAQ